MLNKSPSVTFSLYFRLSHHLESFSHHLIIIYIQSAVTVLQSVMVEGPPISFSPFILADCTLFSHFSFNDFITTAFPDLAKDLDIQI